MSAGGPAIVGQRSIENIGQCGGNIAVGGRRDVGRARGEILKGLIIGQPAMTEEVEAGGGSNVAVVVIHLRTPRGGIARDQGALQKESVPIDHTATPCVGGISRDGAVCEFYKTITAIAAGLYTPAGSPSGITRNSAVGQGEFAVVKVTYTAACPASCITRDGAFEHSRAAATVVHAAAADCCSIAGYCTVGQGEERYIDITAAATCHPAAAAGCIAGDSCIGQDEVTAAVIRATAAVSG